MWKNCLFFLSWINAIVNVPVGYGGESLVMIHPSVRSPQHAEEKRTDERIKESMKGWMNGEISRVINEWILC